MLWWHWPTSTCSTHDIDMSFLGEEDTVEEGPVEPVENSPESEDAGLKGGVSIVKYLF